MKDELKDESVDIEVDSPVEEETIELLHAPSEEKDEEVELLHAPSSDSVADEEVKDANAKVATVVTEDKPLDEDIKKNKIFEKFKIKDIVFLAIMSGCMLLGGSIMPLAIHIPLFGVIHLMLGLQMSLLPVIGLLKVRKTGSLLLMCAFFSVFIVFIQPIMAAGVILCALITEGLVILIFRGYKRESACVFATTVFFPLSLPLLSLYYNLLFEGEAGEAVQAMVNPSTGLAIGISIAVLALCFVGSIIGAIISRELKKAGALKK